MGDGIQGDLSGNPLDRLSWRRLVRCESMKVPSLVNLDDETLLVGGDDYSFSLLLDNILNFVNRQDVTMYIGGSFLGRQGGCQRMD